MAEFWDRERDRERGGRRDRGEGYGERRGGERGFFDRAGDEVRAWFGDDEAEWRRRRDERESERWGGTAPEPGEREWARRWGYVEPRAARGGDAPGPVPGWVSRPWYGPGPLGGRPDWGGPGGYEFGGPEWAGPQRSGSVRGAAPRGPFVGRGPRGYQRSDERIHEDVCERMSQCGDLDASDIEVHVSNGEVTLTGVVHERQDKRFAEDLADGVSGVREVHNQLRIDRGQARGGQEPPAPPGEQRYRIA